MKEPVFTGVCTALVTPFSNHKVDFGKLEELINFQIENSVSALCVCGTTGEAAALTFDEHLEVIAHAVKISNHRVKIIAGTGSNSTAHAVSLSRLADTIGADAVLVVTPYYNKTNNLGLIEHFLAVADAVSCPVILYNVPSRTGMNIPIDVYKTLCKHKRIIGVKEASGNIPYAEKIMTACGSDFFVWSGNDDIIVPLMALGAKGVISVLSNILPAKTVSMVHACMVNDYPAAGKQQCELSDLIAALFCEVNPIPIKHALNTAGFNVGEPRLPLFSLSESGIQQLNSALKKFNI